MTSPPDSQHADPPPPGRPSPWTRAIAPVLAATAVVIAALALLLPSFVGWHIEDDLRTMRWVLEYRGEPWVALTELHSLHDHVRPATLIATWLGAAISDGAWWGPHAVLLSLQLAGLAGLAVLAARLVGTPWAGVLAAMLALTLDGFEALAGWNAWICSAGELAFGLWGLVALHAALRAGRPPLLAIGLLVVAGLFKEPGWLVYPAAGAGMVWTAWRAGSRGWQRIAGLAPIPLGLAGLAITWHPANVYRAAEAPGGWGGNALTNALEQGAALIDTWPLRTADGLPWWAGISLPLLILAAIAAARCSGAALTGVLLALSTCAVMLHFPVVNAVQLLAAGYGLCLLVAAVLRPDQRPAIWLLALLAIGLVHEGIELAVRLAPPQPRTTWIEARAHGDRFAGVGAATTALGAHEAALSGGPLGDLELGPLIGLRVTEGGVDDPAAGLTLQDRLRFAVDRRTVERAVLDGDLLAGRTVPLVRDRSEHRRRPGGGRLSAAEDTRRDGLAIEEAPAGFLALGMLMEGSLAPPASVTLAAADGCGNRWTVTDPPTPVSMTTLRLRESCRPLSLSWSGPGRSAIERVFLAPLPEPDLSLWQARVEQRRLATPEQREIPPIFEPDVR